MGKKKMAVLGTENEDQDRAKAAVKREQKKLREGHGTKKEAPVEATEGVAIENPQTGAMEMAPEEKKSVKKAHVRSKHYKTLKSKVDVTKTYTLSDGIKLLRSVSDTKFDPTVELHMTLKEKGLNREVELPHSTGKTRRVAITDDETLAKIEKNQIEFDVLLASPDQMGKLVKYAKVLGPRGLMPNPKNGTVVPNPEKSAKEMMGRNSVQLKTEKDAPLVHTIAGKLSLSDSQLSENITAVTSAVAGRTLKVVLKSTMSPAIKLQLA